MFLPRPDRLYNLESIQAGKISASRTFRPTFIIQSGSLQCAGTGRLFLGCTERTWPGHCGPNGTHRTRNRCLRSAIGPSGPAQEVEAGRGVRQHQPGSGTLGRHFLSQGHP